MTSFQQIPLGKRLFRGRATASCKNSIKTSVKVETRVDPPLYLYAYLPVGLARCLL
ncbi:unnamed protein product [Chondrus crispus]|uniref:Uncharacterized protein n=1 Tax=Chondrus crispus TaxID=2769 RepID=R7Q9Z9_CHOCR|nr:unnamed protein product [Chondrus crispus]CDF34588.1 unnamed protein product [Chondrus crispus]|eukprot:XP_005714407.1 unnamed protein product [Chondrus crispus]